MFFLKRYPIGNPKRAWRQDRFVLSTFSPMYICNDRNFKEPDAYAVSCRAVKTCADAGFNLLEMGWTTPEMAEAIVPMCESLGLDLLYQNLDIYGGMQDAVTTEGKADVESSIAKFTCDICKYHHIIGYYIWDEPYKPNQISEARRQMDAFEKLVPNSFFLL